MRNLVKGLFKEHCIILFIILVALYFRVGVGLWWDEGQLLHPDERFLAMVAAKIELPTSFLQYFDSRLNPLSPYNNDFPYYVYGTLPLSLTKLLATPLGMGGYEEVFIVGRVLSSVFDIAAIVGVYLIGLALYGKAVALIAALFLTFSVQNIQLVHFFNTESFVAAFVVWTVLALLYAERAFSKDRPVRARVWIASAGLFLGLGLASKISAAAFLPVACAAIVGSLIYSQWLAPPPFKLRSVVPEVAGGACLILCLFTWVGFRVGQPSAFEGLSWTQISPLFTDNMRKIMELTDGGEWPPNLQWAGTTPILFTLEHMMQWEAGHGFFFAFLFGLTVCSYEILRKGRYAHLLPVGWTLLFLLYQSTRFVKYGRYLSIVYPFMALIAAYGLVWLARKLHEKDYGIIRWSPTLLCVGASIVWTVMFTNIYRETHTRIRASRWMYANIAPGSTIGNEAWDDGLPMRIDGKDAFGGLFKEIQLNLYERDDQKKLDDLLGKLSQIDYLVLSSNRAYGTVPRLFRRFPMASQYYKMLFEGRLGFSLVHHEVQYPSIMGWERNTDRAVESFTVYDHPKVLIFRRNPDFSPDRIREELSYFPEGYYQPLPSSDTREVEWIYSLP